MNIALISPNYNAVSETFIKNHKDHLPGNIYYYYDGVIPKKLEGYGDFRALYYQTFINKIKRRFLNLQKTDEDFLKESFQKNKIDIVFAEYGTVGASVYPICKQLNIPLITTWLGYEISKTALISQMAEKYRQLFQSNSKHIVVSKSMIPTMVGLGAAKENIVYSPLPGNELFFQCKSDFKSDNIVAIGRFVDKKSPYNLIFSMKKIVDKFPHAKLTIVGEGPLFNTCYNMVDYLELNKNISLVGNKSSDEIIRLLNEASVFVQHSVTALDGDSEGTPVAILEASMAGLPVVSTLHSGIPDVVVDGHTGFLVAENDCDAFADKVITLLGNKELAEAMGQKGREHITNHFTNKQHIQAINELISSFGD